MELDATVSLVLQFVGGVLYLLNKMFFARYEWLVYYAHRSAAQRSLILGWVVYIIALGPWVILFASWNNWIAAMMEFSGLPAKIIGLRVALRGEGKYSPPAWLRSFSYGGIAFGCAYSFYLIGIMTVPTQWLEIGVALGFLVGTELLSRQRMSGYFCYVVMHVSCGALFYVQNSPWLVLQQSASLCFVFLALWMKYRQAAQRVLV